MSRKVNVASLACVTLLFVTVLAIAQTATDQKAAPATQPAAVPQGAADPGEPIISKMRVQDFPAKNYLYIPTETTIERIGETVQEIMPKILTAVQDNHANITGPSEFVYHGITQDPTKTFQLEIGFPVAEGTKEVGECKVRKLDAFHCATIIYSGPVTQIGTAYQQLYGELLGAGLQPTGENREMYLYWEAPDSPNNVELIMVGIQ